MYPRCLLLLQLCCFSMAQNIELIRDYFLFKNVSRVAGFSCGTVQNDFEIIRMLNRAGMLAAVKSVEASVDVAQFLHAKYWKLGVFLDLRCSDKQSAKILNEAAAQRMYNHLHNWLILGVSTSRTVNLLNDSTYSIMTDLVFSVPQDHIYDLYEAYNHYKTGGQPLNITKLGTWRDAGGLKIDLIGGKVARRWNFHGMKVRAAGIVLYRPKEKNLLEYLSEVNSETLDNWSKFGYSMLTHIAEMFNFTLVLTEVRSWDKNDSNGPLMTGLKNGSFDVVYFPSILTKERFNYARVIAQVWPTRTCFMFRTIPASKVNMNIIVGPFAPSSWYMIIAMLLITIVVLSIILRVEKVITNSDYGTSVLFTIGALCQQGFPSSTSQSASRIAILQVMVFGLLVYNYYSASIVSTRLNAPLDKMNDSLHSLVNSGMKLAAEKSIFYNFLLRDLSEDVQYFKKHWEKIPEEERFLSVAEGIKKSSEGGFAYHADPTDAYPFIERIFNKRTICQLTEVHLLRPSEVGLWSTPSGELVEIMKIGLMRMASAGIRKRQVLRWSSRKPYCNKDRLFGSSVTIREAAPIIIVLVVGMLLALIICFVEQIVFRGLHANQKRNAFTKENRYVNGTQKRKLPILTFFEDKRPLNNLYFRQKRAVKMRM